MTEKHKPIVVLLVEDEPAHAEAVRRAFKASAPGSEIRVVDKLREFRAAVAVDPPDIAVLDMNLPDGNALEALAELREAPSFPILIMTIFGNETTAVKAIKAGALDYIVKSAEAFMEMPHSVDRALREWDLRRKKARAEEALREIESSLQGILRSTADGILAVSRENKVLYANERFVEMWRIPPAVMAGKDDSVLLQHVLDQLSDPRSFLKNVQELYRSKEAGFDTLYFKDGRVFERLSHPLLQEEELRGRVWSFRDITERKRAEEELRKSEERFKLIFGYAPDAYYLNDLKGNFIDGNMAAEKITGYKKEELIGGSFLKLNLLSLDQLPKAAKLLFKNARGLATGPDEFILKKKAGEKVSVEIRTYPVKIENRTVVLGIARDITQRKRAEDGLRQAEENFHRSMNESPLGIRIVNAEGELLYANRAILDIYGYDGVEELRSIPVKKRYTPESYAEYQVRKKKRMRNEDCPSEYKISIVRKTGEIRSLQVIRKEVLWNGEKQFQSIYRDVTEQKRAEDTLQETLGDLRKAFGGIVQVLSVMTEKRDPYTAGHQRRVADLARAIGQEMGLSQERVEGLRLAGIVHDIGKITIPSEILSKPARLTEIERSMVQSHPECGRDILKDIDFAWPIAETVFQHHERIDGSGYPRGLKGESILLEARIIAVADTVEAMASHRPYRPAHGIAAALQEIEKNKGILYDPEAVAACLRLFKEKGFELKP